MASIGVPLARREFKDGKCFATCPECGLVIELKVKKDFESYAAIEYGEHYEAEHREAED